jgi:predicted RND superfamily exporter protein
MSFTISKLASIPTNPFIHLLLGVLALIGVTKLTSSVDTRVYFSQSNPRYAELLEFENKYVQTNSIIAMLRYGGRPITDIAFANALESFHKQAERLPNIRRVDSLVNYPYILPTAETVTVVPFLEYACSNGDCSRATAVQTEPAALQRLVSRDLTTVAVLMAFELPVASPTAISALTGKVRDLSAEFRNANPGFDVQFVGSITQMDAFRQASLRETYRLVGAGCLTIFILLAVLLRDTKASALLLLAGIYGAVASFGVLGWLGIPLNTSTSSAPVIVLLLTVVSCVHVVTHFKAKINLGEAPHNAMRESLASNKRPLVVMQLTTVLGLLTMGFADAPPLQQLGYSVSLGVTLGMLGLYASAPLFARWVRVPRTTPYAVHKLILSPTWSGQGNRLILVLVVCGIASCGLFLLKIDENFVTYFSRDYEFRRGADFAEKHLAGPKFLNLDMDSGYQSGVETEEYFSVLARLTAWLRTQPHVASVYSLSDPVAKLASVLEGSNARITDASAGQLLFAYELSLGKGQDIGEYLDLARQSSRISVLLGRTTSQDIIHLDRKIHDFFADVAPRGYRVTVTGINVPVAYMAVDNIKSMANGLIPAIILMACLVALFYRRAKLFIVAIVSVTLPVMMGLGIWGWWAGSIGLAASVVLAIAGGIVVDDAIHLIGRYLALRNDHALPPRDALERTMQEVGLGITLTSIAITAGFLLLCISGFEINRVLGACTALILICSLWIDVTIVPWLLSFLDRRRREGLPESARLAGAT